MTFEPPPILARPKVAIAMMAGLDDAAFDEQHWERLNSIAEVVNRKPLRELTGELAATTLAEAEVLLGHWGCPTLTADVLALAPRLRMFAYAAGTVKWQVTDAVWARKLIVTSGAAANAVPVAEYTVAMILLANKGALLFREHQRDPSLRLPFPGELGNMSKRIGIIGASFVGRMVVELLAPYALEIAIFDPYLSAESADQLGVQLLGSLSELCATSDVISLHAPDVEATRGMLGKPEFAAMRNGTVFINTARPALVDQDALTAELTSGRISAILDVTTPEPLPADAPLLKLPNVFVTPHIAGSVGTELARMANLAIDEIERYALGQPPLHPVVRADMGRIA